jgi:hypothetical protein
VSARWGSSARARRVSPVVRLSRRLDPSVIGTLLAALFALVFSLFAQDAGQPAPAPAVPQGEPCQPVADTYAGDGDPGGYPCPPGDPYYK